MTTKTENALLCYLQVSSHLKVQQWNNASHEEHSSDLHTSLEVLLSSYLGQTEHLRERVAYITMEAAMSWEYLQHLVAAVVLIVQ